MFDLSKEFYNFYENYTVLPRATQTDLRDKKKLNVERLVSGLKNIMMMKIPIFAYMIPKNRVVLQCLQ